MFESANVMGLLSPVRSLGIGVDIKHTYIGDLRVELVGPTGERAMLHNMTGGNNLEPLAEGTLNSWSLKLTHTG